jgi:hypothetical protein
METSSLFFLQTYECGRTNMTTYHFRLFWCIFQMLILWAIATQIQWKNWKIWFCTNKLQPKCSKLNCLLFFFLFYSQVFLPFIFARDNSQDLQINIYDKEGFDIGDTMVAKNMAKTKVFKGKMEGRMPG